MSEVYQGIVKNGKVVLDKEIALPDGTPVIVMTAVDAYLAGDLSREEAVALLGEAKVAELDDAIAAVERDIAWGLKEPSQP